MTNQAPTQLSPNELVALSREIQAMMAAGVPLDLGLDGASAGFSSRLEDLSQRVVERMKLGASLPDALEQETAVPPVYRAILVAGLRCGRSQEVLDEVCQLATSLAQLRKTIYLGLVYPAILVCAAGLLFAMLTTTLVPGLVDLYESMNAEVPAWLTLLARFGTPALLIGGLGAVGALGCSLLAARRTHGLVGGAGWIPRLLRDVRIARTSHLLALLTDYGIPLPEALRLTATTVESKRLHAQLLELAAATERGELLDQAADRQGVLPAFLRWLIVIGTRNSNLPETLRQAADFYRGRAEARASLVRTIVPPAVMLLVGGSVTLLYGLSVFGPLAELWRKMAEFS